MPIKILFANKMQQEVLDSRDRLTVITSQPGAGATMALILKAIQHCSEKDNNLVTFFYPNHWNATTSGGLCDQIAGVLGDSVRFSKTSLIFTFENGSKIKICTPEHIPRITGLSRDLMLFDVQTPDDILVECLRGAKEAVVVSRANELTVEGSWADRLGVIEKVDGKNRFIEGITHVKGLLLDNYLFEDRERYFQLASEIVPQFLQVDI